MLIFLEAIENEQDRSKVKQIYENYVSLMRCKAEEILGNAKIMPHAYSGKESIEERFGF